MKTLRSLPERQVFWIILGVATLMRVYHLGDWSFSNDELSVLYRTSFNSLQEIIDQGVRTEGHPAGFHLLVLAWTSLVGTSEFWVRLPFALLGVVSVGLVIRVGSKWFGQPVGLAAGTLLAVLPFPLIYSQLARPYSLGLFSCWLALWAWQHLVDAKSPSKWHWGIYLIGATLSCYFHYFSMFLAAIVGMVGLVLVPKPRRKSYLLVNLAVIVLYVPHLSIFLDQIAIGGLNEWLGPPQWSFPFEHAFYALGESWLVLVSLLLLLGINMIVKSESELPAISRARLLAWLFFLLPLVVGFFYSRWKAPILQHSILYFSFPFGLLLLMSAFRKILTVHTGWVVIGLLVIGSIATTAEKAFYRTAHFGVFEEPALLLEEWQKKHHPHGFVAAANLNNRYYFDFYTADTLPLELTQVNGGPELGDFARLVKHSSANYFAYGWSSRYNPYEVKQIIQHYYPLQVVDTAWFNAGALLYKSTNVSVPSRHAYVQGFDQPKAYGFWNEGWEATAPGWSGKGQALNAKQEFSAGWQSTVGDLKMTGDQDTLQAMVFVKAMANTKAQLVMSVHRGGETLAWHSSEAAWFTLPEVAWWPVFLSRPMPKDMRPSDEIKLYLWNPGREDLVLDEFRVGVF
ncbi:MAG: glycosyltransferase family 39 protein [Salibacteraceae bacterium]